MLGGIFKSKEAKEKEQAAEEQRSQAINRVIVTTQDLPQPYEVIGIVSSNLADGSVDFELTMNELKAGALSAGGDAVVGITFQTVGIPTEYKALRNSNRFDNHYHMFSEVKSRAIGTIVKLQ